MIIETFRKGQLVPKRLGFLKVHKKARHRVTFMSDVRVEICPTTKQVNIYKLDEEEKSVIHLPHKIGIKRNNKTYQKVDKITIEKCFIFMKPEKWLTNMQEIQFRPLSCSTVINS